MRLSDWGWTRAGLLCMPGRDTRSLATSFRGVSTGIWLSLACVYHPRGSQMPKDLPWDFILGQVGVGCIAWITIVTWDEENPSLQTSTKSLYIWDASHFVLGSIFIHGELQYGQQSGRLTERTRSLLCNDVYDGWCQFHCTQKQIMLQL